MTKNTIELTAEKLTEVTGGAYDVFQNEATPDTILHDDGQTLTNDQRNPAVECINEDPTRLRHIWSGIKAILNAYWEHAGDSC